MKRNELSRQWKAEPWNFAALDGDTFEHLVRQLLAAEGYEEIRHLGQRGTDDGVDLSALLEGASVAVQCKAWEKLSKGAARKELEDFLERNGRFDRYLLVIAGTCALKQVLKELEKVIEEAALEPPMAVDVWTGSELDGLAKKHPDTVAEVLRRETFPVPTPPASKLVYLSAARADRAWAEVFRVDLEAALRHVMGEGWQVQWDDPQEQGGLPEVPEATAWGVVVVSPEALADRQLLSVWRGALSQGVRSGRRRLLALSRVNADWPPWLEERFERIDLHDDGEATEERYRLDLAAIISKWNGETEGPPQLPAALKGPPQRPERLPDDLHTQLVRWLEPVMERKALRWTLAVALGLEHQKVLDRDFETAALQASAALILARGDDDPVVAALRLIAVVREALEDEESSARLAALEAITEKLRRLRQAAPEPEKKGLLAAWLHKLEQDHERLVDYFQLRHELDLLDRVYVEPELSHTEREMVMEAEEAQLADEAAGKGKPHRPHPGQARSLLDLLALDPATDAWVTQRWVVRGDPGAGKTTLLRHLAARLACAWQPGARVPIFQSLPVLMRSKQPLLDRLEESLQRAAGLQGLAAVLDREGQEGRLLLLLDGLDEVGEHRADAESLIRQLAERWPRAAVVVTTRPIGYRRFASDFRELQLLAFDRQQQRTFLARWFGRADGSRDEARAEKALGELSDVRLADLAGNPLYLTLMAMLLEQKVSPSKNRARLYDQVFGLLLSGKHKHGKVEPIQRPELVRQTLRLLAFTMTLDNRDAEPETVLLERLYRDELDTVREALRKEPRWDANLKHFLDDLAEKVGILGPHDGDDADWRYWHRTFREALCAEHLASLPRDKALGLAEALEEQDLSRWAEPYALLSGQAEEPDDLVRRLVKSNRALGLRALATAQSVSDETLDEILQLTGKWEERSKVYEQLPGLLADPERALPMIERLARRYRGGNDLCFLDFAASRVGELEGASAAEVRRVQRRLYDPIPASASFAALFAADQWRKIPAGTGWIGSLEDEEGRWDAEGPRHRVEITRPFGLLSVPVTNAHYACFDPAKPFATWQGVKEEELAHHPRVDVTWYEAVAFCRWLGTQPGFEEARLPTEEEWEYACRAGTESGYWKGNAESDLAAVGWYGKNSDRRTHRVGEKEANPWGLHDMHGNVWEWTCSAWKRDYTDQASGLKLDPAAPPADLAGSPRVDRVGRGGGYWDAARFARSACRSRWDPRIGVRDLGFRLLLPRPPSGL